MTHALNYLNENFKTLKSLNKKADEETIEEFIINKKLFPISFAASDKSEKFLFKGFKTIEHESEITGSRIIQYTQTPEEYYVPLFNKTIVANYVAVPKAYLIPKEFSEIVELIKLHGIKVETIQAEKEFIVEKYKFKNVEFWRRPYEGRMQAEFDYDLIKEKIKIEKGTFYISTNQRTLRVILFLLEPGSKDSFVHWGFFNAFFERKEYAESYIMEPIATEMLKKNKSLRKEFFNLLEEDENFKSDPAARLDFFYRRSSYFDKGEKAYPILRVVE